MVVLFVAIDYNEDLPVSFVKKGPTNQSKQRKLAWVPVTRILRGLSSTTFTLDSEIQHLWFLFADMLRFKDVQNFLTNDNSVKISEVYLHFITFCVLYSMDLAVLYLLLSYCRLFKSIWNLLIAIQVTLRFQKQKNWVRHNRLISIFDSDVYLFVFCRQSPAETIRDYT